MIWLPILLNKAVGIVVANDKYDDDNDNDITEDDAVDAALDRKVALDVAHDDKTTYLCHVLSLVLRNLQRSQTLNQ